MSKSNKDGFGDKIGSITNRITSMFDILAGQEVGSKEYNTLMYRIMCGQHYQQNAIDRIKGIKFVDMPKYWYDYKACYDKIDEDTGEVLEDNSFNRSIVSNKKPYFFIYIYPQLAKEYNETMYDINRHCRILYKKSYEELLEEDNLTEEQEKIIELCNNVIPVTKNNCTMNKICMAIEKEFEGYKHELKSEGFDYSIMKTQKEYERKTFNAINRLYKEYNNLVLEFKITSKEEKSDGEEYRRGRNILEEDFKAKCFGVCNNREDLCNIILDICYKKAGTKQFAWNICGDQIIKNLLSTHENKVNYPTLDKNGGHIYKGYKFKLEQMIMGEEI